MKIFHIHMLMVLFLMSAGSAFGGEDARQIKWDLANASKHLAHLVKLAEDNIPNAGGHIRDAAAYNLAQRCNVAQFIMDQLPEAVKNNVVTNNKVTAVVAKYNPMTMEDVNLLLMSAGAHALSLENNKHYVIGLNEQNNHQLYGYSTRTYSPTINPSEAWYDVKLTVGALVLRKLIQKSAEWCGIEAQLPDSRMLDTMVFVVSKPLTEYLKELIKSKM